MAEILNGLQLKSERPINFSKKIDLNAHLDPSSSRPVKVKLLFNMDCMSSSGIYVACEGQVFYWRI